MPPTNLNTITYSRLKKALDNEIASSTQTLKKSFQVELVRMHWQIGRILTEHGVITEHPNSTNAGHIARLVKDFKRPDNFFYDVAKFYRLYPKTAPCLLSWSHYGLLIRIDDAHMRLQLEKKANKEKISSKDLRVLTRCTRTKPSISPHNNKLICERGKLYHYKTLKSSTCDLKNGWSLIDLGFSIQRAIRYQANTNPHSGLIVHSIKDSEHYTIRIAETKKTWLFTYQMKLERVIDGDTLIAHINMGFDSWCIQTLRLRGIDAPEQTCALGQRAKNEVIRRLEQEKILIVKTYKQEKYGRFLADIFYKPGCDDPQDIANHGIFLNQELLDLGLAVLYDR